MEDSGFGVSLMLLVFINIFLVLSYFDLMEFGLDYT